MCSANPLTIQDDIAAFLSSEGVIIFSWKGETIKEHKACIQQVLKFRLHILTGECAELHIFAHRSKIKYICGGTEETTSSTKSLKSLVSKKRLIYPIKAVNDANTKYMFDNRYGTGQSTIDAILRTTGNQNQIICFLLVLINLP